MRILSTITGMLFLVTAIIVSGLSGQRALASYDSVEHLSLGASSRSFSDEHVMFDSIAGRLSRKELNARLKNFCLAVKESSGGSGYVISYGAGKLHNKAADRRLAVMKSVIRKQSIVPMENVVFVNGGRRRDAVTEFYVVPKGAMTPIVSPDFVGE